jgi:hypothetical protein
MPPTLLFACVANLVAFLIETERESRGVKF